MSHRYRIAVALALLSVLFTAPRLGAQGPIPTPIPHGPIQIELQNVAPGLQAPNLLLPGPAGDDRLFILEQRGQVRIIDNGSLQPGSFLDVSTRIGTLVNPGAQPPGLRSNFDERGLLGMAFHPQFNDPLSTGFRKVFTYNSEGASGTPHFFQPIGTGTQTVDHHGVIASWTVDPATGMVDPNSRVEIMRFEEPQFNHNGGQLAFGPDGHLYIGLGDGGGANDNNANGHTPGTGNGQNVNTYLGKILRIDVTTPSPANGRYSIPSGNPFASGGGVPEIYAHGFRNPFRFSFDGNRLLVADVGQGNLEELNDVVAGGNYGWNLKEGSFRFIPATGQVSPDVSGLPPNLIDPILEYDHDEGISIIGGFVYHGSAIPELQGKYVFGDFSRSFGSPQGRLFYADLAIPGDIHEFIIGLDDRQLGLFVKGFGIDSAGELYLLGGTIGGPTGSSAGAFKIIPVPEPAGFGSILLAAALLARRRENHPEVATCGKCARRSP